MKLFELYESPVMTGVSNLKSIAAAATSGSDAAIMLGSEPVTLEYPEARYVYGLYKTALKNGQQEQFLQMLANPATFDRLMKPMRNMLYRDRSGEMAQAAAQRIGQPGMQEDAPMATPDQPAPTNTNTLKHIVQRFPKEVKDFKMGGEMDEDLYHALFDYYAMHGEMPYGTMKARDGDPYEWVTQRFDRDVNDYVTEAKIAYKKLITEGYTPPLLPIAKPLNSDGAKAKKAKARQMFIAKRDAFLKKQKEKEQGVVSERWDDDDDDWYGFNDKTRKTGLGTTVTKTSGGMVHKGKYGSEYQGDDGDEDDFDAWGNKKPAAKKRDAEAKAAAKAAAVPKTRGRPSAAIQTTDSGTSVNDYATWYRKVKRSHEGAKVIGSRNKAVAVVQKGNKNYVAGEWGGSKGDISTKLAKTVSSASLSADFKSARGRPKKVREFIENLRHVAEAKNHMDETEYNTYSGWRAACKRAGADKFDGDRDICQALKGGKGVGEWDGAVGTVYDDAHKKAAK